MRGCFYYGAMCHRGWESNWHYCSLICTHLHWDGKAYWCDIGEMSEPE